MRGILKCQNRIVVLDALYKNKKWNNVIVVFGIAGIALLLKMGIIFLAVPIFMLLLLFISFNSVYKWHSSVIQLFKMLFTFNFLFIGCILEESWFLFMKSKNQFYSNSGFLLTFFILYFCLWFLISMIARCEVARLANEIISAILTILFTAGTYISSLLSDSYPSISTLEKMYQNEQALEQAIANNKKAVWDIAVSIINYGLTKLYLWILPFLCISIFCLASISVKQYWLGKNGRKEYWEVINKSTSYENNGDIKKFENGN